MDLPTLKPSLICYSACRQQRWRWRCSLLYFLIEQQTMLSILLHWQTKPVPWIKFEHWYWSCLGRQLPFGNYTLTFSPFTSTAGRRQHKVILIVIRRIVTTRTRWPWTVSIVCHTFHLQSCSGSYCSQCSLFDKYIILRFVNNEIWKSAFLMIYAKLNCFPLEWHITMLYIFRKYYSWAFQ